MATSESEYNSRTDPDVETLPEVPDDGVLIQTLYVGVCHATHSPLDTLDVTSFVGHEVCGKVLSLGSKVPEDQGPRVGDVVVVYPWPGCGQCETCSTENWQLCDEACSTPRHSVGDRSPRTPPAANDDAQSSLDSFQVVSHWRRVVSLPRDSDVAPQVGCLLPCGALRVYAALKDSRSSFDDAVRVRGFANLLVMSGDSVDGLELWAVLLVKNVLCDRNVKVVCASRRRDVVDRALDAGADDAVLLPTDAGVSRLVDATTMSGYNLIDVSFDAAGDRTSLAVAVRSLHRGGTVFELAGPPTTTTTAGGELVSLDEVVRRGVTLRPVLAGTLEQLHELVDVLAVQRLGVDIPVDCCRPDELQAALERLHRRATTGRIVVKYN